MSTVNKDSLCGGMQLQRKCASYTRVHVDDNDDKMVKEWARRKALERKHPIMVVALMVPDDAHTVFFPDSGSVEFEGSGI